MPLFVSRCMRRYPALRWNVLWNRHWNSCCRSLPFQAGRTLHRDISPLSLGRAPLAVDAGMGRRRCCVVCLRVRFVGAGTLKNTPMGAPLPFRTSARAPRAMPFSGTTQSRIITQCLARNGTPRPARRWASCPPLASSCVSACGCRARRQREQNVRTAACYDFPACCAPRASGPERGAVQTGSPSRVLDSGTVGEQRRAQRTAGASRGHGHGEQRVGRQRAGGWQAVAGRNYGCRRADGTQVAMAGGTDIMT